MAGISLSGRPVVLLWLFCRALWRHLLLVLLYLPLLIELFESLGLPPWLGVVLAVGGIGGSGMLAMFRYHYSRRKLLLVHLIGLGAGMGVLFVWQHLLLVLPAFGITLLSFHYRCKDCIRLDIPLMRAEE